MPMYVFECSKCGYDEDIMFSMNDVPSEIECPVENCKGKMRQNFKKTHSTTSTIVPPHMKAGNHNPIKYGKPSRKRVW